MGARFGPISRDFTVSVLEGSEREWEIKGGFVGLRDLGAREVDWNGICVGDAYLRASRVKGLEGETFEE